MLELGQIGWREGVGLGNDGDEIHTRAQALHNFNVKRLKGVAGRTDEVQASMDTEINLVRAARLLLLEHVRLVLVIKEFNDGHPGVSVVNVVTEARGINDS